MFKKYDTLVFCGRFQPFHNGHKAVIKTALDNAKEVVVVVGSSFAARSIKNPFTFEERMEMIQSVFTEDFDRVKIVGVPDYPYDDNAWVSAVQKAVDSVKVAGGRTGLVGHSKDSSSYYLKIFPDWRHHIEVPNVEGINASDIRRSLFRQTIDYKISFQSMVPASIAAYLAETSTQSLLGDVNWWDDIEDEYEFVDDYRKLWQLAPYAPTFVTTDAVLTQSGFILLIKRGQPPFKDCWALPGGYLDQCQFVVDNMIKELREETCVKVPEKVLRGSVAGVEIFDHPDRDPRGRTITHGFHVDLGYPLERLPKVKGADDAKEAKWFHLSDITSEMMAFDHYHIIKHFIPTY